MRDISPETLDIWSCDIRINLSIQCVIYHHMLPSTFTAIYTTTYMSVKYVILSHTCQYNVHHHHHIPVSTMYNTTHTCQYNVQHHKYLSLQCTTPLHTRHYNVQHHHMHVSTMYNTTTYLPVQCMTPPHTCQYNVWQHHIPVRTMYDTTTYLSVLCMSTPHTCQYNE